MSIIDKSLKLDYKEHSNQVTNEPVPWQPTDDEKKVRQMVIDRFALGYTTMFTPRVEFNDLSTIARDQTDFLAWNTYQPNNGDPWPGDQVNGWHSNAIRPVERNKAISIAAHAVSRLLFPKIFATDEASEPQEEAATVIRLLIEYVGEKYNYAWTALQSVIQALVSPVSILHKEYIQTYRTVKRFLKDNGEWETEVILDEDLSGFRDTIVDTTQLFIENFFEQDVQKQGWLVWRRVHGHALMEAKYGHLENFKFVRPGMQVMYNDANQGFYWVYDPNMRRYDDEEVIYYEKEHDLMLVFVNGILLTRADNPNPREDKLYPFVTFGYEFIRPGKCFYYKSLVFKVSHDANIINSIYPMVIDGTFLNLMPPFINTGGEIINSDVIVPSRVTTLSSPNSQLTPIKVATDLKSGLDAMFKVEESINQTSEIPVVPEHGGQQTAYEIAKREQERNTQLGLFLNMIAMFVQQYGRLQIGDILQHLTIADADKITDAPELVYKTFIMNTKEAGTKKKYRKIQFDGSLSDEKDALKASYKTLKAQGGKDSSTELFRVDPERIRELSYMIIVSPDTLTPRSEEVERMYNLEAYDRAIQNPTLDQNMITKTFLLDSYPKSAKDPDKFFAKAPMQMPQQNPMQPPPGIKLPQPQQQMQPNSPALTR